MIPGKSVKSDGLQNKFFIEDVPIKPRTALIEDGFGYSYLQWSNPLKRFKELKVGYVKVEIIPDSEYYFVVGEATEEDVRAWYAKHNLEKSFEAMKKLIQSIQ